MDAVLSSTKVVYLYFQIAHCMETLYIIEYQVSYLYLPNGILYWNIMNSGDNESLRLKPFSMGLLEDKYFPILRSYSFIQSCVYKSNYFSWY